MPTSPPRSLSPTLAALTATQGGVFTRAQALASGCREREIKTRSGPRGDWVRVHRGAYSTRGLWDGSDGAARYELRVRGALLLMSKPAVPSHGSAAVLLRMPLRPTWTELVHVTRPGVRGGRVEGGVNHHTAPFGPEDTRRVGTVTVLGPARTAADIALRFGFADGVVAADAAMRAGATRADLWAATDRMRSWPHVTVARAAIEAADPGAQSVGESLARLLVVEAGLHPVETQFRLSDASRWADADMRVDSLLIEFDGKVKYVERARGGVADKPLSQVVWEEKQREDWMRRQGFGVTRLVWADLWGHARSEAKDRLRRDHALAVRMFGSGPPPRRTA